MNEPLAPELEHKQRLEELALMRKLDKNKFFPVSRYEVTDILAELNLRYSQYKRQSSFNDEFKLLQTVHDYRYMITPLQQFPKNKRLNERISKCKVDLKAPIAQYKGKVIYIGQSLNEFEVFTFKKAE